MSETNPISVEDIIPSGFMMGIQKAQKLQNLQMYNLMMNKLTDKEKNDLLNDLASRVELRLLRND